MKFPHVLSSSLTENVEPTPTPPSLRFRQIIRPCRAIDYITYIPTVAICNMTVAFVWEVVYSSSLVTPAHVSLRGSRWIVFSLSLSFSVSLSLSPPSLRVCHRYTARVSPSSRLQQRLGAGNANATAGAVGCVPITTYRRIRRASRRLPPLLRGPLFSLLLLLLSPPPPRAA
ncbi:hypothetical protein F4775DRAFT_158864 [Biscogniauxia sp. FL1348]|nr:hypothetical protein F4775DRAFT_158864 [Biscogniauxia sp. FL1348]